MDTNSGEFVGPDRAEAWMERLEIGEIVKIKGEELEVLRFGSRTVTLRLRSSEDRFGKADTLEALRRDLLAKQPPFGPSSKKQARASFPRTR